MTIVASNLYSGRVVTGDSGYPLGKAQDIVNGEKGTGTPLRASWVNDQWGFLQALLDAADIIPSGTPDQVGQSDYLNAVIAISEKGNLNSIKDLGSINNPKDGQRVSINGFYADTVVGGGDFVYQPLRDRSDHNGGTVISPAAVAAWDGTQGDLATLLDWSGAGTGCWVRDIKEGRYNPYLFGALADGVSEDWFPYQYSIDAAKVAGKAWELIPTDAYYRVTGPIFLRSGLTYYFNHVATKNDRPFPPPTFGDSFVVMPGAFDNVLYNDLSYDTALQVTAGTNTVDLGQSADDYTIGQTIIIRDTESIAIGLPTPSDFMRFNVIEGISGGVLSLRYEHDKSVTGVSVAKTDDELDFYQLATGVRQKCYVLRDADIHDLVVESEHFWTASTATLNCNFYNTKVKSTALWYGNSFQRTQVSGLKGEYSRQLIEIASNSFNSDIKDVTADRFGDDNTSINLVLFSENSENCNVKGLKTVANSFDRFTPVVAFTNSFNCKIIEGVMYLKGARGTLVSFSEAVSGGSRGNVVSGVDFHSTNPAYLFDMIENGTSVIEAPKLENCNFYGGVTSSGVLARIGLNGYKISSNKFEQTEKASIFGSANNGFVSLNTIPSGFVASSGTLEAFYRKNTVVGNRSIRKNNIEAALIRSEGRKLVTTTTLGSLVAVAQVSAPSFSLSNTATLTVDITGQTFGTGGIKYLTLTFAGVELGRLETTIGDQTPFNLHTTIKVVVGELFSTTTIVSSSGTSIERISSGGFDFDSTDYNLEIAAWVDTAGDTISVDSYAVSLEGDQY